MPKMHAPTRMRRSPRSPPASRSGAGRARLVGEDGGLIAGHARVLAARQLGIAEIPVMVAAGWSEAQKRAYVLADNQLAITGSGWDPELLRLELGELSPERAGARRRKTSAATLSAGSAGRQWSIGSTSSRLFWRRPNQSRSTRPC